MDDMHHIRAENSSQFPLETLGGHPVTSINKKASKGA
jgi:hypothetical protein